jgi:hypothetical protein
MGGSFDEVGNMVSCNGQSVLAQLNQVFGQPNSAKYRYARSHNTFGAIHNVQDNYKDLALAYLTAGLDIDAAWYAYLQLLGTGPQGNPQNIYDIAQTRFNSLNNNVAMDTKTHGGGNVHTIPGSGSKPAEIDSPCPL